MNNTKTYIVVAVVCIMAVIGIVIFRNIDASLQIKYAEYDSAMQIDNDGDLLSHYISKESCHAFISGTLTAVDPVSLPELDGQYIAIIKQKQRRVRHSHLVKVGKTWTTRVSYRWENQEKQSTHCKKVRLLDATMDYSSVKLPAAQHIKTEYEQSNIRYIYSGIPCSMSGTMYCRINDSEIQEPVFYQGYDIKSLIKRFESGIEKAWFVFLWVLLSGVIIFIVLSI